MTGESRIAASHVEDRMPVDLRTLWVSVWKRRWAMLVWALFSAALAVFVALTVAPRVWKSEAVLLYQPPSKELLAGMYEAPSIQTQLNMVKVKPNLAETRMRLRLDATLPELGAACQLQIPRDSQLLVCEVSWDSPDEVAKIANTLTEVFIQRQERLRRMELTSVIREMESRLVVLRDKLQRSGKTHNKHAVARQRELESYRNRINTADEMYEKAITELKAVERQIVDLKTMGDNVRQELLEGETGDGDTISSLNTRTERLRERIMDHRQQEVDELTTIQWEERMRYNERMLAHGFISKGAYEYAKTEYEKHLRRSVDSKDIKRMKAEMEEIYRRMEPNSELGVESSPLMQALSIKSYNLQLQLSAAEERVKQLEGSRVRLHEEYQQLLYQDQPVESQPPHLVESWTVESRHLEDALAKVRAVVDASGSDFEYVSHAARPSRPSRSYRKIACLAMGGTTMMVGVLGMVLAQLLNPTLRSGADAQIKLDRDEVAVLPQVHDDTEPLLNERIRALAEKVRGQAKMRGARILIASTDQGEGRSMLATQLADCIARRGETVVVVDGSIRAPAESDPGLTDYLDGADTTLAETLVPGSTTGVFRIGRGRSQILPDLLASNRMQQLLDYLSDRFDFVLIDGPAGGEHADADVLARHANGVLLVAKANAVTGRRVRQLADRLESTGSPILSLVLNQTDPAYVRGRF